MRFPIAWALLLAATAGCGGDDRPGGTPGRATRIELVATAEGGEIVAEVNGVPVHADCVRQQAEATGVDRREALRMCIDFELLAQEAERKGYAGHPAVLETRKREAVRTFLEREFEPTFDGAEDVPEAAVREYWKRNKQVYNHPEIRSATHVLIPVAKEVAPGSPQDLAAKRLAEELHAHLGDRLWDKGEFHAAAARFRSARTLARLCRGLGSAMRDWHASQFAAIVATLAAAIALPDLTSDQRTYHFAEAEPGLAAGFTKAAFAIPEAGKVSPPARTHYGWHLLLLLETKPAQRDSYDDAAPKIRELLFPKERHLAFRRWIEDLSKSSTIEVDEAWLPRLVAAEQAKDPLLELEKSR